MLETETKTLSKNDPQTLSLRNTKKSSFIIKYVCIDQILGYSVSWAISYAALFHSHITPN